MACCISSALENQTLKHMLISYWWRWIDVIAFKFKGYYPIDSRKSSCLQFPLCSMPGSLQRVAESSFVNFYFWLVSALCRGKSSSIVSTNDIPFSLVFASLVVLIQCMSTTTLSLWNQTFCWSKAAFYKFWMPFLAKKSHAFMECRTTNILFCSPQRLLPRHGGY